ncbi:MAG: site-specific DNA-methyltransferase [Xenococcus sp. (in: cyanobacteria)]
MTLNILDKSQWNRLIWGDNLLAMQALLANGYAGKIDLIYIDPPFASSADYSFPITIEGKKVEKEASIIERLAYTDTWEAGLDSYLDMMYPRLQLMKRLLSEKGSIYIHLDGEVGAYIRLLLDEIFGFSNLINTITWKRSDAHNDVGQGAKHLGKICDTIFYYSKNTGVHTLNMQFTPLPKTTVEKWYRNIEEETGRRYNKGDVTGPGGARKGNPVYEWNGITRAWRYSRERMESLDKEGKLVYSKSGMPYLKRYLDDSKGVPLQNLWDDIKMIRGIHSHSESLNYPTQKPETLLERIIKVSSNEGDLVADFFCGSGTTMAVAERLNRRWIGCNLDKVGIQVSRNRLVNQGAKPFLLENIGNYQRHMIYLSGSKINEMQKIILKLYGAEPRSDRPDLGVRTYDDKELELVYVGYPDRPVTAKKVVELAKDAEILDGTGYKTLSILAWDYDYSFTTDLETRLKSKKNKPITKINPLTIPPEIYNYLKKAKNEDELEGLRNKIVFHEKPYMRITKPEVKATGDDKVVISIGIDRYVLMSYPIPQKQQAELRKAVKDNFAALIDYWAIDWDYDGQTFKSTWQAIRGNGKQAKTVITTASSPELPVKDRTIAVRLVDVFGNDASATVKVS